MALQSDLRLGPYEIVAPIGAGGMGEVYKARDTRLGRDVAIKVLPAAFSADPERLERFEQEARAAAALNHPNILAVYDVGTHDGAPFIVSELLDGETLRERIGSGLPAQGSGLPVRKSVDYAVQTARGLAAAHDKGIVHRDLKPENIFVTTDGRVKILDFGLAKLTQPESQVSASAIATGLPNTLPGVVMGTIGYMAPEQVRGQNADYRADIFAFGAILHEMLSGQRAFRGDTAIDTMSAILKEDAPDLPLTERNIPPALARIVDRCLEKTPAARFKSADDLAFALESVSGSTPHVELPLLPSGGHGSARKVRELASWTLTAVAVVVVAVLAVSRSQPAAPEVSTTRFTIAAPDGTFFPLNAPAAPAVISPDGRHIAFIARSNGGSQQQLWIRALDSTDAESIPGTGGVAGLFWSPNGQSIGFFADGKLKRVDISGTPPQIICDAAPFNGQGGAWNRDGVILFTLGGAGALAKVSASGGQPSQVTMLDAGQGETSHRWPQFLPDGRHFFYVSQPSKGIFIGSLDGEPPKYLLSADSKALYAAPDYVLFVRAGTLLAQSFDPDRKEVTGEPSAIADRIATHLITGLSAFSVSDTGVLTYRTGGSVSNQLIWVDRRGRTLGSLGEEAAYGQVALSRDGRQVAASRVGADGGTAGLWLIDVSRNVSRRLTSEGTGGDQVWSPDGRYLAVGRVMKGIVDLFQIPVGSGEEMLLLTSDANKYPEDWSRDGRFIVFVSPAGGRTLSVIPTTGDRKPFVFVEDAFTKDEPHFSPDGRWLAYGSDESGQFDVYVQPFPGPGQKVRISANGGGEPRWRSDGKELYYLNADGMLMAVSISVSAAGLQPSMPQPLFQTPIAAVQLNIDQYDVTGDGERFLFIAPAGRATPTPFTVVLNWQSTLRK